METKKLGQVIKFCSVIRISRRINFFLKDLMNKKVSHGLNRESLLRQPIKFCPVVGISNCRKLFEGFNQNVSRRLSREMRQPQLFKTWQFIREHSDLPLGTHREHSKNPGPKTCYCYFQLLQLLVQQVQLFEICSFTFKYFRNLDTICSTAPTIFN